MDKYAWAHNRIRKLARLMRQRKLLKQAGINPYLLGGGIGTAVGGGLGALIGGKNHRALGTGIGAGTGLGLGLLGAYLSQNPFGNSPTGTTSIPNNPPASKPAPDTPSNPKTTPAAQTMSTPAGSTKPKVTTSTAPVQSSSTVAKETTGSNVDSAITNARNAIQSVVASTGSYDTSNFGDDNVKKLQNSLLAVETAMAEQVRSGVPLTDKQKSELGVLASLVRSMPDSESYFNVSIENPPSTEELGLDEDWGDSNSMWAPVQQGLSELLLNAYTLNKK